MTTESKELLLLLVIYLAAADVSTIKCYVCDNSASSACGNSFKAYQFQANECGHADAPYKCGKQEQPPDANGWVGVIRGCYRLGEYEGINDTNGCHNHSASEKNFTAIFCFCDTSYCNGAPSTIRTTTTMPLQHWVILVLFSITLSAFVSGQEFALSLGTVEGVTCRCNL